MVFSLVDKVDDVIQVDNGLIEVKVGVASGEFPSRRLYGKGNGKHKEVTSSSSKSHVSEESAK